MNKMTTEECLELQGLDTSALRARWAKAFGRPAPRHMSHDLLLRAVAYHVQEQSEGGLSKAARKHLVKLTVSDDKVARAATSHAPRLKSGARLVREWHGKIHDVTVLDDGFNYRGVHYTSLTRIALDITGTRWSGPLFFGLRRRGSASAEEALAE